MYRECLIISQEHLSQFRLPRESFDFVVSSETRLKIVSFLSRDAHTPTQLAHNIQKHLSHISRALKELEDRHLVACENPANTKPRVYSLTPEGHYVMDELNKMRMGIL
jgi:predicted transcriptional regulator